jgi:hypothetical protein
MAALAGSIPGCRGDLPDRDPNLVMEVSISPTPPAVGPARLIILLRDTLGVPLEGARIRVEGNMSHAGMVPVLGSATDQGAGTYVVPDFHFTMAGAWVLTVTATLTEGRHTEIRVETGVVGAPPGFPRGEGDPETDPTGLQGSGRRQEAPGAEGRSS